MSQLRSLSLVLAALGLAACEPVPQFGPPPGGDPKAPAPQILPVGQVLAAANGVTISAEDTASLDARAEALRRRADAVRARQFGD